MPRGWDLPDDYDSCDPENHGVDPDDMHDRRQYDRDWGD